MESRPIDIPAVMNLLGARYLKDGRTVNGLDCYGFLVLAFRELGIYIADDPQNLLTYRDQFVLASPPIRAWDVLLLNPDWKLKLVQHVALVIDDGREVMHADSKMGGVVQQPLSRFTVRLRGIARLKIRS